MEKSKDLLEIETELSKTKDAYFAQAYIPPPTVEDAVESITLAGESLYRFQLPIFVEAVREALSAWLGAYWQAELEGLGLIEQEQPHVN